jgi:putative ABC transport system permease protein
MRLLGRAGQDFDAELESHIGMHVDDWMRAGLSAEEARRQALVRLGGAEQARQAHRDGRTIAWLETLLQDVRYGLRALRRTPGFTITAVLTLGLGIGACTAIFSLVNAVLLRSLPYGEPERLVYLFTPNPNLKIPAEVICPSYGDFYDIQRESRSYANMSNFEQAIFSVGEQGPAQRIGAARVDENFFSTLQSPPELGRTINADDNRPSQAKVAVISHALWRSMFGGRGDVLARSIQLDGASYQIVGVMPSEFEYPDKSDLPYGNSHIKSTQIWVPLILTAKERANRSPADNVTIARLRSGVTIHEAQAEMSGIMARLDKAYAGDPLGQWGALLENFTTVSIGPVRPLMRLLLAAVGLVLLIACGNAANLLLARATERSRELGVRAALGAGRSRIVRQLLTEALLISVGSCATGIVLAFLFLRLLPRLDPGNIPRLNEASLDERVLAVAIIASVLTSLATGLLPAISASRMELTQFLKSRGSCAGHSRLQSALIIAQAAMVVVLLAGAGLLIRSYINVESVDTGFSQATVTFSLTLDKHYGKAAERLALFNDLIDKLGHLPGVNAAGAVNYLPLSNSESVGFFWVEGYANEKDQLAESRHATPQYFQAMGIPLVRGRLLTKDDDAANSHVVLVNESFADRYFAGRDPIGGQIGPDNQRKNWNTVVGVVADVRHMSLEEPPGPQIYYPFSHDDWASNVVPVSRSIVVRSALTPPTLIKEMRTTLAGIDPNLALTDLRTMGDLVSQASARRRFQASLLTAFAGIALVLALVGLYGLMAYSVNRRTHEVGIRMALGAQRWDVLTLVLKNAGVLIGSGLVLGLASAWVATRAIQSFLFGVSAHDPATVAAVCGLLLVCGLLAALVPARRAASIDPMTALRTE